MKRIPFESFANNSELVHILIVLNETRNDMEGKTNPLQSTIYESLLNEIQPISTKTSIHYEQILEKQTSLLFHLQKIFIRTDK